MSLIVNKLLTNLFVLVYKYFREYFIRYVYLWNYQYHSYLIVSKFLIHPDK